jgi:hypothetical protein
MIATVASFVPTILVAVLTAVFLVAGMINLSGRGTVKADFARWGFPAGLNSKARPEAGHRRRRDGEHISRISW